MPENQQPEQQEQQEQQQEVQRNRIDEIRSDSVQEIIGKDPNWIIRWGITVVFITVLILLFGTWVIKYPEIITTRISITTQNPPIRIVARSSGKIHSFLVKEMDHVKTDQILAVLENTANFEQVLSLQEQLSDFDGFLIEPEKYLTHTWAKNTELGELQVSYSNFLKTYVDYQTYLQKDHIGTKIHLTEAQIENYQELNERLKSQQEILQEELNLYKRTYETNKNLFEKEMISESDFVVTESSYLSKKYSTESAKTSMVNNRILIGELKKSIMELGQERNEQKRVLLMSAQQTFKKLESDFEIWMQKYVLKAPTEGYVSFFKYWSENQYVNQGEEVMVITPDINELVGKIYLPQYGAGKVEVGQRVNIKFDSYPFKEFGMVIGAVHSNASIARENQYLVNVNLPNGLKTSYDKEINFKYNMEGTADIITEDLRLIDRIFNQFRYLLTNVE